jgi:nucleotide-binding universal stress UspA family protein
MEFRRILVPLDGSDLSEHALPLAEQLARRTSAEIVLARAPFARAVAGMDAVQATRAKASAIGEANAYLASVRERLATHELAVSAVTPGTESDGVALSVGDVVRPTFPFRQVADVAREAGETIAEAAESMDIDLIVMATHARSGIGRWLFGSVAMEVIHRSLIPILLIRPSVPDTLPEDGQLSILVPLDGSPRGEQPLTHAAALVRLFGGQVVLAQAIPSLGRGGVGWRVGPHIADAREHEGVERSARNYLTRLRDGLQSRGVTASVEIAQGDAAVAIGRVARQRQCSLIVMATHGRTGLARLALGSVAEGIMASSELPVLIVHTTDKRAAEVAADAQARPVESELTLSLNREERELIASALHDRLATSALDGEAAARLRRLLRRIEHG